MVIEWLTIDFVVFSFQSIFSSHYNHPFFIPQASQASPIETVILSGLFEVHFIFIHPILSHFVGRSINCQHLRVNLHSNSNTATGVTDLSNNFGLNHCDLVPELEILNGK
jgi:hypothetical protein